MPAARPDSCSYSYSKPAECEYEHEHEKSRLLFVLTLLLATLLSGCLSQPRAVDHGPVVAAFRRTLETYYEEHRLREQEGWQEPTPPRALAEERARAGTSLLRALDRRGFTVPRSGALDGLRGMAPSVERFLHRHTRLAFAQTGPGQKSRKLDANAWPGSFLIAAEVERATNLRLELAGLSIPYHRVSFRRLLCPPYDAWLGERRGLSGGSLCWVVEDVAYLDLGRIERSSQSLWFDRLDTLRGAAAAAEGFQGGRGGLASLVKDALRWRAMGARLGPEAELSPAERRRRFAEARGAELVELSLTAAHMAAARRGRPVEAQAGALIAVLDGVSPLGALASIAGMVRDEREPGLLAFEAVRAALLPGAADDAVLRRLLRADEADCRRIVKLARSPGGLLDRAHIDE